MTASTNVKKGTPVVTNEGREAAILVLHVGRWCIRGTVTIEKDTPTNVRASDNQYYARPDYRCRGFSATAKPSLNRKLSFDPDYIALAKLADQELEERRARRSEKEKRRLAWLQEVKPNMAYRITNKIQSGDSEDILMALVNLPTETLLAVCTCLGLDAKYKVLPPR